MVLHSTLTNFGLMIGNYSTGDFCMTCILTLWSLVLCLGFAGTDMLRFLQPGLVGYEIS